MEYLLLTFAILVGMAGFVELIASRRKRRWGENR